jgi:Mycobacterium membrane protein
MNDPRRPGRFSPPLPGSGPTGPQGPPNPPPVDPAYADQAPYAPTYGGGYIPQWTPNLNETNPTKRLPAYWQQDQPPPGELPPGGLAPPPPEGPKSPRWLWIGAGAAVLLVVGLVIALVLTNGAIKTQTAVPPLPAMPGSSPETPTPSPTTRTSPRSHTPVPAPPPSGSTMPTETTGPAAMQSVVYNVSGDGRAISITYWDTGDVIQTEFNVALPWSKEVTLSQSAGHPASVTIINIGHNVTCTLTVDGVQVRKRVGAGITICDAPR